MVLVTDILAVIMDCKRAQVASTVSATSVTAPVAIVGPVVVAAPITIVGLAVVAAAVAIVGPTEAAPDTGGTGIDITAS
jgi:hypothetical protein